MERLLQDNFSRPNPSGKQSPSIPEILPQRSTTAGKTLRISVTEISDAELRVQRYREQWLRDLAECDPEDACFFCGIAEVIARRLHGTA